MLRDKRKWNIPRRFVPNFFVSPPIRSHSWSPPLEFLTSFRRSGSVTPPLGASRSLPPRARLRCVFARALLAAPAATMVPQRAVSTKSPLFARVAAPRRSHRLASHVRQIQPHPLAAITCTTGAATWLVEPALSPVRHVFVRCVRPRHCPRRGGALPSCSGIPAVESHRHCAMKSQERACALRRSPTRGPTAQVILRHRSHGHNIWCSSSRSGTTPCALFRLR